MKFRQNPDRRQFLRTSAILSSGAIARQSTATVSSADHQVLDLADAVGIVSASMDAQLKGRAEGRNLTLLELPAFLRDELDIRVLDLNTSSFPDFATVDRSNLDRLRGAAEKADCVITNLKMNQRGIDMNSLDEGTREKALAEYRRSIDIAAHLGCRWARPLPTAKKPNLEQHVASYQRLCQYAAEQDVQMLIENFGWMQSDAGSVVALVKAVGNNVAAGVDTGNWNSQPLRDEGLRQSFPLAATCDFKARQISADGQHSAYSLRRCFDIAWSAGFRGPWCLEHGNRDSKRLAQEFLLLRDRVRQWTAEKRDRNP